MSQSPETTTESNRLEAYQDGWKQLNGMLSRGGSFSGREQNCCYLNLGTSQPRGSFVDISSISGFDLPDDGRALAAVDWDHDGDLDLWTTNRTGPRVRYFQNNLAADHHQLQIMLEGVEANRDAVGARVELELSGPSPVTLIRTVHAGESYLTQSSRWLHFGLGKNTQIKRLVVRWPGSREAEEIRGASADRRYRIVQGTGTAVAVDSPLRQVAFNEPSPAPPYLGGTSRMAVVGRIPFPPLEYQGSDGSRRHTLQWTGKATLVNFWASWCRPCIVELAEITTRSDDLRAAGLDVVALSAEPPDATSAESVTAAASVMERLAFPFRWGQIESDAVELTEAYLGALSPDYRRPLQVPTSLLLDRHGQVAVVYRGPVDVDDLLADLSLLESTPDDLRSRVTRFAGRWLGPVARPSPLRFAGQLKEDGKLSQTESYLRHLMTLPAADDADPYAVSNAWRGEAAFALGSLLIEHGRMADSIEVNRLATQLLPRDFRPHVNLGSAFLKMGEWENAITHFSAAFARQPDRDSILTNRATAYFQLGRTAEALRDLESALQLNPANMQVRQQVAALYFGQGNDRQAAAHYRQLLQSDPKSVDAAGALSWILATSNNANVRDGATAQALAQTWCEESGYQNPKALNALAAAHAELGEFDEAVRQITRAIELAQQQQQPPLANLYRQRLELYRNQRPVRR